MSMNVLKPEKRGMKEPRLFVLYLVHYIQLRIVVIKEMKNSLKKDLPNSKYSSHMVTDMEKKILIWLEIKNSFPFVSRFINLFP